MSKQTSVHCSCAIIENFPTVGELHASDSFVAHVKCHNQSQTSAVNSPSQVSATDSDDFAFYHDSEPPPPAAISPRLQQILHLKQCQHQPLPMMQDTRPPLRLMEDDTTYPVAYHIPITAPLLFIGLRRQSWSGS